MNSHNDHGRVAVMLAGVMPVLLLFMALVWDASGQLRAQHRADHLAAEAARAAGQAVDLAAAMRGDEISVDPQRAVDAATAYLGDVGVVAADAVIATVATSADGRRVTVTVEVTYRPLLMAPWRATPGRVTGEAVAHLVDQ